MQYYFVLGKTPELSVAEILSVLPKKTKMEEISSDIIIINTEEKIDAKKLQDQLGGTIKIGQIWDKYDHLISNLMVDHLIQGVDLGSKIQFGCSIYNLASRNFFLKIKREVRQLGIQIKKQLKIKGFGSRFVTSKEDSLPSVVVSKNNLIKKGAEIIIIPTTDKKIYIGNTLTVQDFEKYSQFDYGRPARDDHSGMIPPKLAKIMINLAQVDLDQKILDPFCGSGTILQQAALMGYKNLIGSDLSAKAIEDSQRNFTWVINNQKILCLNYDLQKLDVQKISQKINETTIDAIVTEPYLGPPRKGGETEDEILATHKSLEKLYLNAFNEFYKILEPKGKIVIIFPVFYLKDKKIFLDILDKIKKLKFKIINPLERLAKEGQKKTWKEQTNRNSIIYRREGQRVGREIFIFIKNS